MKEIDVGYRKYSLEKAERVCSFSSLVDYDPTSIYIEDAIGEHYSIFRDETGSYLFHYRVKGQSSLAAPGFVAAEGFFPIPLDVAMLLIRESTKEANSGRPPIKAPVHAVVQDLRDWHRELALRLSESGPLHNQLLNDISEMVTCLDANAFRGCLAMAGVVLERSLKATLSRLGIQYPSDSMVGKLIERLESSGHKFDPSLKSVWQIVNIQRIIGVHAKELTPIPNRDQAIMVAYAVKSVVVKALEQ